MLEVTRGEQEKILTSSIFEYSDFAATRSCALYHQVSEFDHVTETPRKILYVSENYFMKKLHIIISHLNNSSLLDILSNFF